MRTTNSLLFVFALALSLTGCQPTQPVAVPTPTIKSSPSATVAAGYSFDNWLGQWNGPEGTYLLLSKDKDQYLVKIQSLDGPATYEAVSAGDHLEFKRGGKTESIRAGSGKETGMKWLLDEKNCLVIKEGEGFCRK